MKEPVQARMTLAEYQDLPEDGTRYEVFEGELMMSPAPGYRHQRVSGNLFYVLETWRRTVNPDGVVLAAPFDVVLAEDTIVQPDLLYLSPERRHLITDGRLLGAPDLVVEIFQTRTASRDRVAKLQIYARYGVPEYWLVDLDSMTVNLLGLEGPTYRSLDSGSGEGLLKSRSLAGLEFKVRDVFAGS